MITRFVLFVSIMLAIVVGGHILLYLAFVRFLGVNNELIKSVVFIVLICLSFSFIAASLLVHWQDNAVTRFIYDVAGFWLGVMLNLVLASAVVLIIFLIFRLAPGGIALRVASIAVYALTIIYCISGVWNAAHPKIKDIEVTVKNLPTYWQGKTIVQLSDVHLGSVHRPDFLARVVSKVNEVKPEAVVITGDLFDGMDGNLDGFVEPINKIEAPSGVFFITGNHEVYLGLEEVMAFLKKTQIKVLNDEIVDIKGLQIIGLSYPEFEDKKDVKNIIRPGDNYFADKSSILLYHTPSNIDTDKKHSSGNIYWHPDTDFSYVKNLGIDLQLSGHVHKGQLFPFTYLTKFIYHGYDYGLHRDGDFSIYVSSGTGTWGPPMRTGNSPEIVVVHLK